jgi:hypothetical protein
MRHRKSGAGAGAAQATQRHATIARSDRSIGLSQPNSTWRDQLKSLNHGLTWEVRWITIWIRIKKSGTQESNETKIRSIQMRLLLRQGWNHQLQEKKNTNKICWLWSLIVDLLSFLTNENAEAWTSCGLNESNTTCHQFETRHATSRDPKDREMWADESRQR